MTTTSTARAPKLTKKELEKYRRLLEEKKSSLSAELAKARDAEEETTEESTQDIADKAVSSYTREFLYSLSDGDRTTLAPDRRGARTGSTRGPTDCATTAARRCPRSASWPFPGRPFCIDCQELAEKGMLEN